MTLKFPVIRYLAVADPGGAGEPVPPPFGIFFLTKAKFTTEQKLVLNEYEICLKMLEIAILETQIFKTFGGGGIPPDLPRKLAPKNISVLNTSQKTLKYFVSRLMFVNTTSFVVLCMYSSLFKSFFIGYVSLLPTCRTAAN